MCRNIRLLFNFEPPVTDDEIRAASLQFVRKISGFNRPSQANEAAFNAAVESVAEVSAKLLRALETTAPARNREEEAAKLRARSALRFKRVVRDDSLA
jgi:hypothetical protein